MINDQMTQCRYCSVPVDPGVAELIADRQQKANQAVSDASFLRTATITLWVFVALSFIPFLPFFVELGLVIVGLVTIFLMIRWQVRFSGLLTSDPDYQAARKSWRISMLLTLFAIPVAFIVRPIIFFVMFATRD
jgi:uncharacterized membrane protein